MNSRDRLYYEVPRGFEIDQLRRTAERSLRESQNDIAVILSKYDLPPEYASDIAVKITGSVPRIDYEGSGSVEAVVAVAVSLVPVIKALTPLLQPFAKCGADLAYEVGHDIWAMLKKKMLHNNIRLIEKRSK